MADTKKPLTAPSCLPLTAMVAAARELAKTQTQLNS